jgi:hypothetical protein
MTGCEKDFIAAVAHQPGVVALRVEGIENIKYARRIAPDKFIIGLVKMPSYGANLITPTRGLAAAIHAAGADMVATQSLNTWLGIDRSHDWEYGCPLPWRIMADLSFDSYEYLLGDNEINQTVRLDFMAGIKAEMRCDNIILATTFEDKGFDLLAQMKSDYPFAKVNLEGGITTVQELSQGFEAGANWVTIGKAINDPPTIIDNILNTEVRKEGWLKQTTKAVVRQQLREAEK